VVELIVVMVVGFIVVAIVKLEIVEEVIVIELELMK